MSTFTHVILEVFCSNGWDEDKLVLQPEYCIRGVGNPGYHCFEHKCRFLTYTYAPNELAYSDETGEVPDYDTSVGFGGDMEPKDADNDRIIELKEVWEEICRKKIKEAYIDYMHQCGLKTE